MPKMFIGLNFKLFAQKTYKYSALKDYEKIIDHLLYLL